MYSIVHVSLHNKEAVTAMSSHHYFHNFAAPMPGLYFTLNGTVYQPGDTVLITAIGDSKTDINSSLVCVTSNVNTQCCRGIDGGRVGEWYFPNGTIVPRNMEAPASANFTRKGFTHQVRLNRRNNAMSPTGIYECRVRVSGEANASNASDAITANASIVTAQITVGE